MEKKHEDNVMDFPTEHRDNLRILEALLFAASEPLDAESIKARLPKKANLEKLINLLKAQYDSRGVNLVKTANKWSFKTAPDLASMMQKEKVVQRKLSKAATETLAIIAYHQPVTRAEVEDISKIIEKVVMKQNKTLCVLKYPNISRDKNNNKVIESIEPKAFF